MRKPLIHLVVCKVWTFLLLARSMLSMPASFFFSKLPLSPWVTEQVYSRNKIWSPVVLRRSKKSSGAPNFLEKKQNHHAGQPLDIIGYVRHFYSSLVFIPRPFWLKHGTGEYCMESSMYDAGTRAQRLQASLRCSESFLQAFVGLFHSQFYPSFALFSFSFSFLLLNIKILTKEVVVRRDLGNRDSSVNQAHGKRPLYKNSKVIYFIPFPLWAKLL